MKHSRFLINWLMITSLWIIAGCGNKSRLATADSKRPTMFLQIPGDCYDMLYHIPCRQALWVRYTLSREYLNGPGERKNNFKPDPRIPPNVCADNSDYARSGYDRGHLAPAADMVRSQKCMDESFYLSNISPQLPGCNRGVWKRLESQVRDWTTSWDSLLIYTGPVLVKKKTYPTLGENQVCIPEAYYKSVLGYRNQHLETIAFVVSNTSSSEHLSTFVITVDSLETLTGIDFFTHLPDSTQQRIEAAADFDRF